MKEFKGTPGPWRVSEKRGDFIDIRHNNNEPGAMSLNLAHIVSRLSWLKEAEANAHLIAAAPELLEALQEILDVYGDTGAANFWSINESVSGIKARTAINKALGETK